MKNSTNERIRMVKVLMSFSIAVTLSVKNFEAANDGGKLYMQGLVVLLMYSVFSFTILLLIHLFGHRLLCGEFLHVTEIVFFTLGIILFLGNKFLEPGSPIYLFIRKAVTALIYILSSLGLLYINNVLLKSFSDSDKDGSESD